MIELQAVSKVFRTDLVETYALREFDSTEKTSRHFQTMNALTFAIEKLALYSKASI
jgi:hypothetical protein